jgi:predicted ester cyclase
MSVETNKALVRRYVAGIWDGKEPLDAVEEIVSADFLDHAGPPNLPRGPEAVKMQVVAYRTGVPDLQFSVDFLLAEGDLVACRWTGWGTQSGPLFGIPPTGKRGQTTGTHIYRIANGRIVERWGNSDDLGLLQQLGAIPPMS